MSERRALARIDSLTDDERRSALCFLAGFAPEALDSALSEMDYQRTMFAVFMADRQITAEKGEW